MPATIEKAVEIGVPMSMMRQVADVQRFFEYELIVLAARVNVDQRLNLQDAQIPFIAREICERFKGESMEDISLCLRRGAMGIYGEIYRLDGAVITSWMTKYLEEKYAVVETNLMAEKDNFYFTKKPDTPIEPNPERNLLALLKTVVGEPKPAEENNAKRNEYERERMAYKPLTADQLRTKELHIQWARENHDPRTGKPLPTWISEEEWLKKQDNKTQQS